VLETPVLELVDLIYAAALQVDLWPKALEKLADLTRSQTPALVLVHAAEHRMVGIAPRTDPDAMRTYGEHWIHRNPLEQATRAHPVLEIVSPDTVMGVGEFARTPVHNEWGRPSGLGTVELKTNLRFDGGFPTILNINRQAGADDYSGEDVALFAFAARHFARAVEVSRVLSASSAGFEAMALAMHERGDSAVLVDDAARIVFATQPALALLEAQDGLCLADAALSIAEHPGVLERLIASCQPNGSTAGGSVVVPRRHGGPLKITVAPVPARPWEDAVSWPSAPMPAAIIVISDPDAQRERRLDLWRDRFGLTPAEARFALEVIKGGGRQAAAQRFGISDTTARAHLTNICAKTGVSRQSELVALLLEAV
jgi:DNA-binding CsgD family transcriptional regulator